MVLNVRSLLTRGLFTRREINKKTAIGHRKVLIFQDKLGVCGVISRV